MRAAAFRRAALELPEAEELETWGEATFRVRNKIFAMLASDGKRASIKAPREEQRALLDSGDATFYYPEYVGVHGWIGVVLASADAGEVTELLTEGWRMTAPRRLVKVLDEAEG